MLCTYVYTTLSSIKPLIAILIPLIANKPLCISSIFWCGTNVSHSRDPPFASYGLLKLTCLGAGFAAELCIESHFGTQLCSDDQLAISQVRMVQADFDCFSRGRRQHMQSNLAFVKVFQLPTGPAKKKCIVEVVVIFRFASALQGS